MGLVTKNAILLIDYANRPAPRGAARDEALIRRPARCGCGRSS